MRRKIVLSILAFCIIHTTYSYELKQVDLSHDARISLVTIAPGTETYSIFGHSAIRVFDPQNEIDYTFNYGTFDFMTPFFYVKFVRGNLEYFMDISTFRRAVRSYRAENRSVNEMLLNLSKSQKQLLYDALLENYKPENRYYKYDFFFDNCATRIRDIIVNSIDVDYYFHDNKDFANTSYRELLHPYIEQAPWLDLGINLALGLPSDQKAEVWGSMYLPDHLKSGFEFAYYKTDSVDLSFIRGQRDIFKAKKQSNQISEEGSMLFLPVNVFILILLVVIVYTVLEILRKKNYYWLDKIIVGLVGTFGLVILLLWTATEHRVMNDNLNILWALPSHIVCIWFLGNEKKRCFNFIYYLVTAILLVLVLVFWNVSPQKFHFSIIPLIFALLIRSIAIALQYSKIEYFNRSGQ